MFTPTFWLLYVIIGLIISGYIIVRLAMVEYFDGAEDFLITGATAAMGITLIWPVFLVLISIMQYFEWKYPDASPLEASDDEGDEEETNGSVSESSASTESVEAQSPK